MKDRNNLCSDIIETLIFSVYHYAYSKHAKTADEINNQEAIHRYQNDAFFNAVINTITAKIIDIFEKHEGSE